MRRNNFKMRRMYIVKSERKVWLHYSCSAAIIDDLFSGNFTVIHCICVESKWSKSNCIIISAISQYKSQTKSHALFCLHRQFDWWNMAKKKTLYATIRFDWSQTRKLYDETTITKCHVILTCRMCYSHTHSST